MLKKRIIPMLLLSQGRMVKGKQFSAFRDTGDPVSAARIYNAQFADELVFLDVDANRQGSDFEQLLSLIDKVSSECFMPLSVGGGVNSVEHVRRLVQSGADKVVITTAALENPGLINDASAIFGRQCIVVGLDVKREGDAYRLYSHCGRYKTERELEEFIRDMTQRGAGEFIVNAIDRDGMMQGYDLEMIKCAKAVTERPVLAAGGAGTFAHLAAAFQEADADAVVCASIFHFGDNNPIRARSHLLNAGVPMKLIK
ncbi:glycosyl amidation-associated protein WbuZ [Hahella aquimaris]|uniref:glycosyl amidation-associated protein WbuZ n=1 Tax=Hahella sp. HNIBRBA332 TaxID=3015983 RepID=UPI00273B797C|nr:glycosyl amidation-associated protein WbuZ [Hahella sp. HNIBRBA332]WLQ15017.1 glycosyl amidation-associated protein WbuZ [Hahella sp. HNIBRBA332]